MTPFEEWWAAKVNLGFFLDDSEAKRIAHEAWLAALAHIRETMFIDEEEAA